MEAQNAWKTKKEFFIEDNQLILMQFIDANSYPEGYFAYETRGKV